MANNFDFASLSARVYRDERFEANKNVIPNNWEEIVYNPYDNVSGFVAGAYRNTVTGEIVIAYKGTDTADVVNFASDWGTNIALGTGVGSLQAIQAAQFYLDIKNAYPGANISFTGHSLGGGLASIMAVWFDRPAVVFDAAPFELGALTGQSHEGSG